MRRRRRRGPYDDSPNYYYFEVEMSYQVEPVGRVIGGRAEAFEDEWRDVRSVIRIAEHLPADAALGLADFSHLEVVFLFDRVDADRVSPAARHPRGDNRFPVVGIFASRGPNRPNRLAVSRCRLLRVDGRDLHVADLDALDGTPVLDVKPYLREFAPRTPVTQPGWAEELMRNYY
ncbi:MULTISPECIES: SAM-dependent methyltransferase [unclassified Plantactinospora]|uniref:SAM-dependent methyltransferase n=1 Tax=unclassified Plantactinospora TaxID=2631981 RepID=UPI001F1ACB6E|nr:MULTISPECIES: SAM-dependent methyltransferase [unclassified Plantactinospora]